jgi:pentatricopeptide repeat protein
MSFRYWLRQRLGTDAQGDDVPPGRSLLNAVWGREEPRMRALGEYNAGTYPSDLKEMLTRRQNVAEQLLEIDISDRQARIDAIPQLREMLRTYPHPLVYETLIHAYVDARRFDEARGVAFAARERRVECMRSDHPEIRSEVQHLSEWTPEDIQALREG